MIVHKYYRNEGIPQYIDRRLDLDHNALMNIINNPIIKNLDDYEGDVDAAKHSLPLYFFGDLRDRSTIYLKGNYGIRSALVLDYDKDVVISDWYNKYEGDFEFYIHTSFKNTDNTHKFRVIIPTTFNFYMCDELKECVFDEFTGIDPSSLDNRGFYAPGYYDKDNYGSIYSSGKTFNISDRYYDKMQNIVDSYIDISDVRQGRPLCSEYDRLFHEKCIIDKARTKLDSVCWSSKGGRFMTLRAVYYYLYKRRDVVDKNTVESLFGEYNFDKKQEQDLKGYMRKW